VDKSLATDTGGHHKIHGLVMKNLTQNEQRLMPHQDSHGMLCAVSELMERIV
jgi:hypothetical protein